MLDNHSLSDREQKQVQVTGIGSIPDHGVTAALLAVHIHRQPNDPIFNNLPNAALGVTATGQQPGAAVAMEWESGPNVYESVILPVMIGADGAVTVTLTVDRLESIAYDPVVSAYVDVLGVYCDRDLPTSTSVSSTTHPSGEWSAAATVEAQWAISETAPDASGVAGYAVAINSDGYFVPDAIVTHQSPEISTDATPGRQWLHVRPIAHDGTGGRTAHYPLQSQSSCSSLDAVSYVPAEHGPAGKWGLYMHDETIYFPFSEAEYVPENASAVRLAVRAAPSAANDAGLGVVSVYPASEPWAGAAQILYQDEAVAVETVVRLGEWAGTDGAVAVTAFNESIVDVAVIGYYVDNGGQGYSALENSARLFWSALDPQHAVSSVALDPTAVLGGGSSGIPGEDVGAVVATIMPYAASDDGFIEVKVGNEWMRIASIRGGGDPDMRSVQATIPVSAAGELEIRFTTASGSTTGTNGPASGHMFVDAYGWYSASGSEFHPMPEGSRRLLENTTIGPSEDIKVPLLPSAGIPEEGLSAIEGSVHVVPGDVTTSGHNYMSTWPSGSSFDGTAVDLWDDSSTTAGQYHSFGVTSAVGDDGSAVPGFQLYNHTGTHTVSFDASGYFCRPTPTIVSSTHPVEGRLYPESTFEATWTINDDASVIDGYQVAFTQDPDYAFPSTSSPAPQTAMSTTRTAPQGTSWLLVRAISTTGVPSTTARFQVNVGSALDERAATLGFEPWWSFVDRSIGPDASASVNVATGNLVVQQNDIPPIQAAGDLAFNLRRTYNSQDPGTVLPDLFGLDFGDGWNLNLADLGDMTGLGGIAGIGLTGLPTDPTDLDLAEVAGLTMVDRDGTRHTYTPEAIDAQAGPLAVSASGLSGLLDLLGGLVDDPVGELSDLDLEELLADPIINLEVDDLDFGNDLALCVDSRYTPPAGVHVAMWRYVLVDLIEGGQAPNSACGELVDNSPGPAGALAIGYTTVRPDRVAQTFGFDGRLLSLRDGAGNELAYSYDLLGTLADVYEPGVDNCTPATTGCRTLSFTEIGDTVVATDPAGRHVAYTKTNGKLTAVTVYDNDSTPQNLDPGDVLEQWRYRYDDGTTNCGSTGLLCEIDTPRVIDEALTPITFAYNTDGQVDTLTESGDGTEAAPSTSFAYTDAHTDVARGNQATRYSGIDAHGRVSEITDAATGELDTTPLRRTRFEWDNTGATCEVPTTDTVRDNNLCASVRVDVDGNSGGDRRSSMDYNAEGNVVRSTSHGDDTTGGDAVTTYAYRTINYQPDGDASISEDAITGDGNVMASPRPDSLFAVTDLTATLTPRGNTTSSWDDHLTRFSVDATAAESIGTVGADGSCGSGNSGLACSVDAPEGQTTVNEFNARGQMTSTRTPTATHPDNGAITYHYAPDTDSGAAAFNAGWLTHVEDADGNRVTYDYDPAANVTGVWDRNAWARTAGNPTAQPGEGTQVT